MDENLPVQQSERNIIVDIIRGFALTGVLIANFTSYNSELVPTSVLDSISSPVDKTLLDINTVLIEWKFWTLFSILFGYGFGLILSSLEKKNINPTPFFLRRMFWLFVLGFIHTIFWWGDVLNLYAMSGILLLLFRKSSPRTLLICSLLFMFIVVPGVSFLTRNIPDWIDDNIQQMYLTFKNGGLADVFSFNLVLSYKAFIITGWEVQDVIEILGKFLFGFFLLRIGLFHSVESKKKIFVRAILVVVPVVIAYYIIRYLSLEGRIDTSEFYWVPFKKLGIICTTILYVSLLTVAYISYGQNRFFKSLQALGKMTLTNYLMVSAFLITLLYGIGFGKLGEVPMHIVWLFAAAFLVFEILFSNWWLSKFRYGPVEWIWRQLTYRKRIQLRK